MDGWVNGDQATKAVYKPRIFRSVLSNVMTLEFNQLLIGRETQTKMILDGKMAMLSGLLKRDVEWPDGSSVRNDKRG